MTSEAPPSCLGSGEGTGWKPRSEKGRARQLGHLWTLVVCHPQPPHQVRPMPRETRTELQRPRALCRLGRGLSPPHSVTSGGPITSPLTRIQPDVLPDSVSQGPEAVPVLGSQGTALLGQGMARQQ